MLRDGEVGIGEVAWCGGEASSEVKFASLYGLSGVR